MRKKKKWLSLIMAGAMCASLLAGCGSSVEADKDKESAEDKSSSQISSVADSEDSQQEEIVEEDPFLTGEKPVLKLLRNYSSWELSEDPMYALVKELSGYDVEYHYLPSENGYEKLMIEVASGTPYDLIRVNDRNVYSELDSTGALMDLTDLLNKYGQDLLENIPAVQWASVTNAKGEITGIPTNTTVVGSDSLFGGVQEGIIFRSDLLEDLGMDLPSNLEEFYEVAKAYTEKKGSPALTVASSTSGWVNPIASAFGMGSGDWYENDGEIIHKVRMEGFEEYVAYMQKLYNEGLLDKDFPINAVANAKEKFASGNALCTVGYFYDATTYKEAIALTNPDAELLYVEPLAKDENSTATVSVNNGAPGCFVIPKYSENPEHAVIYYNAISRMDNFTKIFIGEENVSYEIKDGQYYPIFPAFNDYGKASAFVGSGKPSEAYKMWIARCRKTEDVSKAFESLNNDTEKFNRCDDYVSYASTLPAYKEHMSYLTSMYKELLLKGIVEGTDAKSIVNEIITAWESNGGLEVEQEVNAWWPEFKATIE